MNQIPGYLGYLAVSAHLRSPLDIYLDSPREGVQISGIPGYSRIPGGDRVADYSLHSTAFKLLTYKVRPCDHL